ncbi:iron-siderophore ABC transporter substrate-binding protein [Roseovarius sp. MMSF_3281]|uniref:iron-siderophore ABC transporter substrate-binding protein n=1 Tax=Roseovarius sp. MMSF_3281 TaxID=3046694 RepID=UPI00273D0B26|nr:iron-siderophore ABC transporter substrate-binding protein [Roseovarius sp. MMSF_3281]
MRFPSLVIAALFLSVGSAVACEGVAVEDPAIYGGDLCLDAVPERVVVLDPSFGLGVALDAGLQVVGAPLDAGLQVVGAPLDLMSDETLKARAERAGVTSIGAVTEPSMEAIVALQPDLILGFAGSDSMASGIHPMASQLAPTLLYTNLDWRGFYRLLAPLGDKASAAAVEAKLADFEARMADLRTRVPRDRTLSVVRITSWDFQVYMDAPVTYAPFALLRELGVQRSAYETTEDPSLSMKRPDLEELAALDGDVLFYIVGGTNDSDSDGRFEEVTGNPLWQMLPAVEEGRAYRVDHAHWMEFSGLDAANAVLDDVERYLIGTP